MTTTTLPHFDTNPTFQDVVAANPSAASVDVEIQNIGSVDVEVVARASGGVPANTTGLILKPRKSFTFNNAQIWVRSLSGQNGRVSLLIL